MLCSVKSYNCHSYGALWYILIEITNITNTAVNVNPDGAFEISKYFCRTKSGSVKLFLLLPDSLILHKSKNIAKTGQSTPIYANLCPEIQAF